MVTNLKKHIKLLSIYLFKSQIIKILVLVVFVVYNIVVLEAKDCQINAQYIKAIKVADIIETENCIKQGATINFIDSVGKSGLMYAAENGDLRICYLLYKHKGNFKYRDKNNKTAKDYAENGGYLRVKQFLVYPKSYSSDSTCLEYFQKSTQLKQSGKLIQAISCGEQAIQRAEIELTKNHRLKINIQNNQALLYIETHEYNRAEPLLIHALEMQKILFDENDPENISTIKNLGLLYNKMEEYDRAAPYYFEVEKIEKEIELKKLKEKYGENNKEYALVLTDLASLYYDLEKFESCESLLIKSLNIQKDILGIKNTDYAGTLNSLATFYFKRGNFVRSEELFKELISLQKELTGEKSAEFSKVQSSLANLYLTTENYPKAKEFYIDICKTQKEIPGNKSSQYLNSILNLAYIYRNLKEYQHAETLYLEALNAKKEKSGENNSAYCSIISNLATMYYSMGNNDKAKPLLNKALSIQKQITSSDSVGYAKALYNLAVYYFDTGDYTNSETYYLKALGVLKLSSTKNYTEYLSALNGLAFLYIETGNYAQSESILVQALDFSKKESGKNPQKYADALNSMALIYYDLGNFSKAESLLLQSIKIRKELKDEDSRSYALALYNLASVYCNTKKFIEADSLFLQASQILKNVFGVNHPDYANSLNNLGGLYAIMGNYSKAESILLECLKLKKELIGELHPDYASTLFQLATVYSFTGRNDEAKSAHNQCLVIRKLSLGEYNHDYILSLDALANLYCKANELKASEPKYIDAFEKNKAYIFNNFSFLSENERTQFWQNEKMQFDNRYPSFAYKYYPEKPSISTFAYNNALFTKGLLLNTSVQIQNAILQSGDSTLIDSWNTMRSLRQQIKMLESKPLAEQLGLQALENQADSIDKVLTKKSQLYKQSQAEMQQQWTDVQNNLQPDEAAIEFVSFRYYNKQYTDSMLNYALVLKKNSPYPELIPLFENKQLDSLFLQSSSNVNQLYTFRLSNLRQDNEIRELNYGEKLYDLVWKPLEKSLQGIKTVYYSPSGKLHQVSFVAIPVDSTLLLSDKYNLYQVTSTREVIKHNTTNTVKAVNTPNTPKKTTHEAVLFGGIQYELDEKQLAQIQTTSNEANNRSVFVNDSNQRSGSFGYLKGTADEVNVINTEFLKNGSSSHLLTGITASESQFKNLTGTATEVIHVATHGFYLPVKDTRQEEFRFMGMEDNRRNVVYQNPLLRSGLIFAGANKAWKGESIPDNWEDGILTAQEITQLNLTKTQLVVLSACETGLGDDGGSEGVFGLQRAFKMAGVQTLIMSLWKVPDTQTSQLMQSFYKYWLSGMTRHDAFAKAQNEVRKSNPNPYFWAAFVMVD